MDIVFPTTKTLIKKRNALLQKTMRPRDLPFDVSSEYPIVLDPQNNELSYCVTENDQVIAHANLWPRVATSTDGHTKVGLVGNVATAEACRGRGVMRQLFTHLENEAREKGLNALILWSDLVSFYQNLGFRSLSKEFRFVFHPENFADDTDTTPTFKRVDAASLSDKTIDALLLTRCRTSVTLSRATSEFRQLLTIPDSQLYVSAAEDSYFILGKGYDMQGVVHEWGVARDELIYRGIKYLIQECGMPEVMLLAPQDLDAKCLDLLARTASRVETHPMALIKPLRSSLDLDNCFIWGMDSI